jgi:hypothetical protein
VQTIFTVVGEIGEKIYLRITICTPCEKENKAG